MRTPEDLLKRMTLEKGTPAALARETELKGVLGRWPKYTPVNVYPLVQFIGISPGGSPGKSTGQDSEPAPEYSPELFWGDSSDAATAFGDRRDSNNYWRKVADLGGYIVRQYLGLDSDIDPRRLLAHINLSEEENGKGGEVEFKHPMTTWVPEVTYLLGARVILCGGNRSHLRGHNFTVGDFQLDWAKHDRAVPFETEKRKYKLLLWFTRINGEDTLVVSLPNHPSKHPFGGDPATNKHWAQLKSDLRPFLPGLPGSSFGQR